MSKQTARLDATLHRLSTLGLIIYPLVAHAAILIGQQIWAIYYLLAVFSLSIIVFFSRFGIVVRISGLVLYLTLITLGHYLGFATKLIYLPPILIPAWLAIIFIGSLRSARGAIISQVAVGMAGKPLDPCRARYTKYLTAVWGGVFVLMVIEALSMAILAPFEIWSWWVHVGNYLVVVILFAGELIIRSIIFGGKMQLTDLLRMLVKRPWHERH